MDEGPFMELEQPRLPGFKLFLTKFTDGDLPYSGRVAARDWQGAQLVCAFRPFGEVVIGEFDEDIPCD
ncbi:MAG: hypothetical protein K9H25_23080 [Rhodospirillum sp.]|nr:hypothetical protein [Rhodospirillum sp.]MCF8491378.1 hypothetical protein [Rhodospirillum sp.]MCF8500202.1 hypothetical protein [Rhodospirillum sp.]